MVDEYQRQAGAIKARIAALRSGIAGGLESYKAPQARRIQDTAERPQEEKRVETRIEPDWDAIERRVAENDAKEAKADEMEALRSKFNKKN